MISYSARMQCFLMSAVLVSYSGALDQKSVSIPFSGQLNNLRVFNEKLYIGGTNLIYVLNKDFSINQTSTTCASSKILCGNVNKVFLVNEKRKELLICGTGKDGICEIRSTENIRIILRNSTGIKAPLKVSTDPSRPAQCLLTQVGDITIAVTFGEGDLRYFSYKYAISTRNFIDFEPVANDHGTKVLFLDIEKFPEYIIYYKASFQHKRYTYFVTSQKEYVGGTKFVSKLVRLCQNDTDFNSYTDIVLTCSSKGLEYNLVQQAVLLEVPTSTSLNGSDIIFVGVFTRGSDPNTASGDSAICIAKLKDLDDGIMRAKKNHALSCEDDDPSKRYLPNLKSSSICFTEEQLQFRDFDFSCENAYPSLLYVIGNVTYEMTSSYLLVGGRGMITALNGVTDEENAVIFAGTSTGYIVQLAMKSLESPLEEVSTTKVGTSIMSIHIEHDDAVYVLSSSNVYLFSRSSCSEYTTCSETMAGRNPLCGWCVYRQSATRKTNCSDAQNHWIPSVHDCNLQMNVTKSSIPVDISKNTSVAVTFTIENLPEPQPEDIYVCRLSNLTIGNESDIIASRNGSLFSCILPLIEEHAEKTIELSVLTAYNESIPLSEAALLFFECEIFERCGECISRSKQQCDWCAQEARCQPQGSPCIGEPVNSKNKCPKLLDTRGLRFVHAGVSNSVHFHGKHIPDVPTYNKYVYTCKMSSVSGSSIAFVSNNSIYCSINMTLPSNRSKEDQRVRIYYGAVGQRPSPIEDEYANYVTVYNCTLLAKDCSQCRAINTTKYQCDWCTNKNLCGYQDENCTTTQTCPAPTVTMVVPRDGPVTGSTEITIYGSNLGSSVDDIEGILVADIPCNVSDDVNQFLLTDYGDFKSRAPNRLICTTGFSGNETTGPIYIITVNELLSESTVDFSYLTPVVTDILPRYGPRTGGTRVTIYGENLGIGNRRVNVLLEDKVCLKPEVRPYVLLEELFLGNFTIECTVGSGYRGNITNATLYIDDNIVEQTSSVFFRLVDDPVLQPIPPKKAFLSGGTKITMEGKFINNANDARITLAYGEGSETGTCNILSESKVVCRVPEAPQSLKEEFLEMENASRKYLKHIKVKPVLHLDNIQTDVEIIYCQDPTIHNVSDHTNNIIKFEEDDRRLIITGEMLNTVATKFDINVTVGLGSCVLVELTSMNIACIAPRDQPKPGIPYAVYPEINVTIGNIHKTVGYVQYVGHMDWFNNPVVIVSAAGAAAVLILFVSLATILICRQYRNMKKRLRFLVHQASLNENSDIIRLDSMSPKNDCYGMSAGYSDLYSDIREPGMLSAIYNTIVTDVQESDVISCHSDTQRQQEADESLTGEAPEQPPRPERLPKPKPQMRSRRRIMVEIQLEGANATNVSLVPKRADHQSYLHPIHYTGDGEN